MKKLLSLYILSNYLIFIIKTLKCDIREIQHCKKCGIGILSDSCAECEEKYFLLYSNISCIKCNDEQYGQVACIGKCDGSKYNEYHNVLCDEEGCKEGFYNLDGFCFNCTKGSEHCTKCTYQAPSGSNIKRFKCIECEGGLNGDYRVSDSDGICHTCQISNCIKCHFIPGTYKSECDVCQQGYYANSGGCSKCNDRNNIDNGYCYYCPVKDVPNSDKQNCRCNSYYTLKDSFTCIRCPNNCLSCEYNQVSKLSTCSRCDYGYSLKNGNCIYCGINCKYCNIDTNNSPICTTCYSGYRQVGGKCYKCPSNCRSCLNSNYDNNELVCDSCYNYYYLNPSNGCSSCPNNCPTCQFSNNKFICNTCSYNNVMNKNSLCESCSANEEIGGVGCINCQYASNRNYCYKCSPNYIFISNDYICRLPLDAKLSIYCENATNVGTIINPKYSCA